VDYGMGNLNSVKRKLDRLQVESFISSNPDDICSANKLILPGVGNFSKAIENLNKLGLRTILDELALEKKIPILGICLGMQLMLESSEEGNAKGLAWIKGQVVRFSVSDPYKFKVPHTGWNSVTLKNDSPLMKGLNENAEFYFVHSYHVQLKDDSLAINITDYDYPFVSGFQKGNIFGLQYHPEKSHDNGDQVFKNFIEL
jgi:glutamine amidotransferase